MNGYFTAFNRLSASTVNILGNSDLKSAMLWMDNWCKANPLKRIAQGMELLTEELYPNRHKTMKEAGR
jgi:hypothetical protein